MYCITMAVYWYFIFEWYACTYVNHMKNDWNSLLTFQGSMLFLIPGEFYTTTKGKTQGNFVTSEGF